MDLNQVRVGDLVRFVADFDKHGVERDEIGEVVACYPEALRVTAPGRKTSAGGLDIGPVEVDVAAPDVLVLVDARDDRISSYRIDAQVSVADLEDWVSYLAMRGVPVWDAGLVALETLRRGAGRIARVARRADRQAWATLMQVFGYDRTAKSLPSGASLDLVRHAEQAMGNAFLADHGRPPDLAQRRDALWLVHELYQDLVRASMEDEFSLEEDESGAFQPKGPGYDEMELQEGPGGALVPGGGGGGGSWDRELADLEFTLESIRETSDEAWTAEITPYLPNAQAQEIFRRQQEDEEAARADWFTQNPAEPLAQSQGVPPGMNEAVQEAIERQRERHMQAPEAPPAAGPPELEVLPGGGGGAEYSTSRNDTVPIKVPQYMGAQRVWAEPGMRVYKPDGSGEGTILGFSRTVPDGIVVDLGGERTETWDAVVTTLAKSWSGKPTKVPPSDMDRWKQERRDRLKKKRAWLDPCYLAVDGDLQHPRDRGAHLAQ